MAGPQIKRGGFPLSVQSDKPAQDRLDIGGGGKGDLGRQEAPRCAQEELMTKGIF